MTIWWKKLKPESWQDLSIIMICSMHPKMGHNDSPFIQQVLTMISEFSQVSYHLNHFICCNPKKT